MHKPVYLSRQALSQHLLSLGTVGQKQSCCLPWTCPSTLQGKQYQNIHIHRWGKGNAPQEKPQPTLKSLPPGGKAH